MSGDEMSGEKADKIASLVLEQFEGLRAKRKPAVRDNGIQEWVPLSAIVAQVDGNYRCLALATGMKCLPATKLPVAKGSVVHDWHAEILALRTFNHFLLEECKAVASGQPSSVIRHRSSEEQSYDGQSWQAQPFALIDGVTLHMYCSEAPCGDASMELTMADQADASPWEVPSQPLPTIDASSSPLSATTATASLPGRAYFSSLGIVRRKPSRPDAPPTLSKSCSDKLSLHQCTSLLSSLTSLLVHPSSVYLSSIILPSTSYSPTGCSRAFSPSGRMSSVAGEIWGGGYSFTPFEVLTTGLKFRYSKRAVAERTEKMAASNLAVAWHERSLEEGLVGGVLQGRRQFDVRGGSKTSRRRMWELAVEVARMDGVEEVKTLLEVESYSDIRNGDGLADRRRVKDFVRGTALKGWVRNVGDDDFGL